MWKVYIGVVVDDRIYNSKFIKVYIHDFLPFESGQLEDKTVQDMTTIENVQIPNSQEPISVNSTNVIVAEYLNPYYNIQYPPFVRKGQRVIVLNYADTNNFYWLPLGIDHHLNQKGVFRFFVKDTTEDGLPNDQNSYYVEIDTLFKKRVIVQTAKADGEQFKYTILIDAKRNRLCINDDDGREIILNSTNDTITMKNKAGSHVTINADNTYIEAPTDIVLKASNNLVINATNIVDVYGKKILHNEP